MSDSDKPKVVSLKSVPSTPIDENSEVMIGFLEGLIQAVKKGEISQICAVTIDDEEEISVGVAGANINPFKMAYVLQNEVSFTYLSVTIDDDEQ